MTEILVLISIVITALWGFRKRGNTLYLSNSQGKIVKGISALFLVIIHIRQRLEVMPVTYRLLATGGYLFVSMFFFYSGFGITKNSFKDPDYLIKRLPRRIIYLFGLIFVSEVVYYLFSITLFENVFSVLYMIKCILGIRMLNGACWTLVAMIIIQMVFFLLFCLGSDRLFVNAVVGCVVYILISVLRGRGAWEMQSCGAFVLGVLVAEKEDKFKELLEKRFFSYVVLFAFVVSFSAPYISESITGRDYLFVRVFFGTIASVSFVISAILALSKVELYNGLIVLLGNISTEVYLWHGLIIDIMKKIIPGAFAEGSSYVLITFAILICVIIVSSLIWIFKTRVKERVHEIHGEGLLFRIFS